mmetsp:Transcript_108492/g.272921  ORF Transcript_108492/g.272921 Transcript_108492/m.272921 type:complete len:237 (+) Transcript_108492:297-1007(+)
MPLGAKCSRGCPRAPRWLAARSSSRICAPGRLPQLWSPRRSPSAAPSSPAATWGGPTSMRRPSSRTFPARLARKASRVTGCTSPGTWAAGARARSSCLVAATSRSSSAASASSSARSKRRCELRVPARRCVSCGQAQGVPRHSWRTTSRGRTGTSPRRSCGPVARSACRLTCSRRPSCSSRRCRATPTERLTARSSPSHRRTRSPRATLLVVVWRPRLAPPRRRPRKPSCRSGLRS